MDFASIKLVAFDLDDTLAPSKSPLPHPMREALMELLDAKLVCIISGGQFGQFESQVIANLPDSDALTRLHLMPTCGTRYDVYEDGAWQQRYQHLLSDEQRQRALTSLETEAKRLGLWESQTWGPILEDRGSQITFSALGQQAPVDAKKAWDPDGSRREKLRAAVSEHLPDLDVHAGGSTSVDITMKGIDKAYGIGTLMEMLALQSSEVLFIGDRLMPGGNDYPVLRLGVHSQAVTGWEDTLRVLRTLLDQG